MACQTLCIPPISPTQHREWNMVIKRQALQGKMEQAIMTYIKMLVAGINGDNFTLPIVFKAATLISSLPLGAAVHGQTIKTGFSKHAFVQTSLVSMYASLGYVENASRVFDKMTHRDLISWNSMLNAYASYGQMDRTVKLFDLMPVRDQVSFNIMIFGYSNIGSLDSAEEFFNEIPVKDVVSWNSMISACVKAGQIDSACRLFEQMPERNVISWNTIIGGCVQSQRYIEAVDLFYEMKAQRFRPNNLTLASVLSACAHIGSLKIGRGIHIHAIETCLASNVRVATSLIDMYAKCGSVENALEVFYKCQEKDVCCWNSMISGLAIHGHGQSSIKLFNNMTSKGLKPDDITFIGVLSACSHAGLVDVGQHIFKSMQTVHDVRPRSEHYGCMVDIFSRAGLLDRAYDVVENMPFEPVVTILGALLSACVVQRNVEMGQIIAGLVVERADRLSDGEYIMLANMYATCGRWEEASRWRAVMNNSGIIKTAGCSMIEVDGIVYRFLAVDVGRCASTDTCVDPRFS